MKHLDHDAALALAEGGGGEAERRHCMACERCRRLVEECEHLLDALRDLERAPHPPRHLVRWARAFASAAEPAHTPWRILRFLSQGATLVAATRAATRPGTALLYGDESHHVDLRIEPTGRGSTRVHGQIVPLTDAAPRAWEIRAVGPDGEVVGATTDAHGEFWLSELASWKGGSLVATSGDERVVVPRIGQPPDGGDGPR